MLSKLFPNVVKLFPPEGEAELKKWKEDIERDVVLLREANNRRSADEPHLWVHCKFYLVVYNVHFLNDLRLRVSVIHLC